ncbi:MAG TPA: hypothetical protein VEI97_20460, partial [bacterium]|nr:hypothetical protein [bacterium]
YAGVRVYVANTTGERVFFHAQDSRLRIVVQILDPVGKWRDIERMPTTTCGNSYHRVWLESNEYWAFVMPRYGGGLATQMRVKVSYGAKGGPGPAGVAYSAPFAGRYNPSQLWRQQAYVPEDIMDPYLD